MSAARHLRRRQRHVERAAARSAGRTGARALRAALAFADTIGPVAAHHGLLVAIQPGPPVEVYAVDRFTGQRRCWGCGDELLPELVGQTLLNGDLLAKDPAAPMVLIRACATCMPPAAVGVSA